MSLATALLTPILGDASPWTPRRLFQLGEAGGVYDPSDLTAEKVAWRRNLLTWSEDFTNAAWTATNVTVVGNNATAPNGTLTADTLTETTANGNHQSSQAYAVVAGTYTVTARVRWPVGATRNVGIAPIASSALGNNKRVIFNSSGQFVAIQGATGADPVYSSENLGGGWWLFTVTAAATSAGTGTALVRMLDGTTDSYTGSTSQSLEVWGAQIDAGPATAYQRITDFTSDFLAAFPTHGLYQDAAGTTPVTALGQPVGLVIDSKTGGLANVGPELVTNGDFSSGSTGWTLEPGWSVAGGVATYTPGSGTTSIQQPVAVSAGKTYLVTITVVSNSGSGATTIYLGASNIVNNNYLPAGRYQFITHAVSGSPNIYVYGRDTQSPVVDNISVREVPGVHAIQPTNSSRPLLDGRVNLLTFSEQFDNAAWFKGNVTAAANTTVAPDGTTTAETIANTASTGIHAVYTASSITLAANTPYRLFWHVKKGAVRYVAIGQWNAPSASQCGAGFDLDNGTVTGTGAVTAGYSAQDAAIYDLGAGWYRLEVTCTTPITANFPALIHRNTPYTSGVITESYLGAITDTTFIWGADLRLAADAAYPYQRVAAATDYADVGVPRAFAFDGFDDSLYTASNMDLSGTDKVTVLAGVRKLSDAAGGVVLGHGVDLSTSASWEFQSNTGANPTTAFRGLSSSGALNTAGFTRSVVSPATFVFAALVDYAAAAGSEFSGRYDGVTQAQNVGLTENNTGNFGNRVLTIGSRQGGATQRFNGKAYQLIVRGALTDDATLAQAQRYVGAKTGLYI